MALALSTSRVATRAVARTSRSYLAAPKPLMRQYFDFDQFLADIADKFEKSENKPVVIGYSVAAIVAFFTAEWLIHLPALDFLLGFPIQLIGLLAVPYLAIRYLADGGDVGKDVGTYTSTIIKKLPGLDK